LLLAAAAAAGSNSRASVDTWCALESLGYDGFVH
jgi:hypothetical protein